MFRISYPHYRTGGVLIKLPFLFHSFVLAVNGRTALVRMKGIEPSYPEPKSGGLPLTDIHILCEN